ncbi:MAG TPA: PEP-CTERM sorting domain-containing protein [Tepidisphaeraceae bacterium]|nr:PEP-CTERM sorting domain-containing protein [Tepidisphaeraceae bacterium]
MNAATAIAVPVAGKTMTLSGLVSGSQELTVDVGGGGTLRVTGVTLSGSSNSFAGNWTVNSSGGTTGRVALAYGISSFPGQTFSASAGTLSLGDSAFGVTLNNASTVQASGAGVVELSGRGANGTAVVVGGNLTATAGGKIVVGDAQTDDSGITFLNTANVTADGGTVVLRPRAAALTLDNANLNSLTITNGGALVLAGTSDLTINKDVAQAGAWTLTNQSASTLKIAACSQDTTAGLTLRAEAGVTRYEATALKIGGPAANGAVAAELRGGTIDLRNDVAGVQFTYQPASVVGGWGQIGTSAANQSHVIPAGGGVQFYATAPGAALTVVGGIDETAGTKAAFRIGDNGGVALAVPNATQAAAYAVGAGAISADAQGAGSAARFVAAGGVVRANASAFSSPANRVRLEAANGGTLVTDLGGVGTTLVMGSASGGAMRVASGGSIVTTSATFTLNAGDLIGGAGGGTLFGFAGTATAPTTALTLNGTLALDGSLGATVAAGSTGTVALQGGQTLKLLGSADMTAATLSYSGTAAGAATIEAAAGGTNVVRIGATPINTAGDFGGTRQFAATSGILQVDAADANSVTIGASGALSVDRTSDATANPTLLGALAINGGTFQIGAGASTTTVTGTLAGKGVYGHTATVDTFVNQGTVQAVGGTLTINAGLVRATDTSAFNPNGQTLTLRGGLADFDAVTKSKLRVVGGAGGTVVIAAGTATPIAMSGGTLIDGSSTGTLVAVRVPATGALGTGPVTLNLGQLSLNSDVGADLSANSVAVEGAPGSVSVIAYDRAVSAPTRIHKVGPVTMNGQTLALQGFNAHTLNVGSLTVGNLGGLISTTSTGGATLTQVTGVTTVNGPLTLDVRNTYDVFGLAGGGAVTRTLQSGTVQFRASSPTYTGLVTMSGGTSRLQAASVFGTGTYQFGGGTVQVDAANALGGSTGATVGAVTQTNVLLNVTDALSGSTITHNNPVGSIQAFAPGSIGTGTVNLAGGQLRLLNNASTNFGGIVSAGAAKTSTLVIGPLNASGLLNQTHGLTTLGFTGGTLNVTNSSGYGMSVGTMTSGGAAASNLSNEIAGISAAETAIGQTLNAYGSGPYTIGRVGGSGTLVYSGTGTMTITGAALSGFTGTVQASAGGIINLNDPGGGALMGGVLSVNGGRANLNFAGTLNGATASLTSGTLASNAQNAMSGSTIAVTNGTLSATVAGALDGATINLTGGNVTATAAGALGTGTVNVSNGATVALRSDVSAAMGGNVAASGTTFVTLSVAPVTLEFGPTGQTLSINNLSLSGGQTVNVTGANEYALAVVNPVAINGSGVATINATAADMVLQGALTGAAGLSKSGLRTLTLNDGGNHGATTVTAGTLAVNGAWTTAGVTIGSASGSATLDLGGGGVNAPGAVTLSNGTLRIGKTIVAGAIPAATVINAGATGDAVVSYFGASAGTMANEVAVTTAGGARKLTIQAEGLAGSAGSTLVFAGPISKSGAGTLGITLRADPPVDDGGVVVTKAPGRLVMGINQGFSDTWLTHGGGVVVARGNVPSGSDLGSVSPLGLGTSAVALNVADSTVGLMVGDGQTTGDFYKSVTTAGPGAGGPRKRFGAYRNASGAAGTQTVNFRGEMQFNDATSPLKALRLSGQSAASAGVSSWNGFVVEPNVTLQFLGTTHVDNIISSSAAGGVTAVAPVYVGGGGRLRFTSTFTDGGGYRNLDLQRGTAGTITVMDDTTLENQSSQHHFDSVELRGGTFQAANVNQNLPQGLIVGAGVLDTTKTTSNVITSFNLTLPGTGQANGFRIGAGQTLVKSGTALLFVSGDQGHGAGSALKVTQGSFAVNTDSGMNASGPATNKLAVELSGGALGQWNASQHLASVVVNTGASATVTASGATGGKVLHVNALAVTDMGRLDLANNALVVDYAQGATSPADAVRQMLLTGRNGSGALWAGVGLTSSTAQAASTTLAIGFGEAASIFGPSGGTFYGQAVDGSAIVARVTRIGDADLDGTVGLNDLVRLSNAYGTVGGQSWATGDFDYNGNVDLNDLVMLSNNYGGAAPDTGAGDLPADFAADWAYAQDLAAGVPEPSGVGLVVAAGLGWAMRRRRVE